MKKSGQSQLFDSVLRRQIGNLRISRVVEIEGSSPDLQVNRRHFRHVSGRGPVRVPRQVIRYFIPYWV
jgi:hypothetical protein